MPWPLSTWIRMQLRSITCLALLRKHSRGVEQRLSFSAVASAGTRKHPSDNQNGFLRIRTVQIGSHETEDESNAGTNLEQTALRMGNPIVSSQRTRGTMSSQRTRDAWQTPKKSTPNEDVYVLTLKADPNISQAMTDLRNRYFPKKYHLPAHVTLFHALPSSRLESDILPALEQLASKTGQFYFHTIRPTRIEQGFIAAIHSDRGQSQLQELRDRLRHRWEPQGFLSPQDSRKIRMHYTLMNKIRDEGKIEEAFAEASKDWEEMGGLALGFRLYRYAKPWKPVRDFNFNFSEDTREMLQEGRLTEERTRIFNMLDELKMKKLRS